MLNVHVQMVHGTAPTNTTPQKQHIRNPLLKSPLAMSPASSVSGGSNGPVGNVDGSDELLLDDDDEGLLAAGDDVPEEVEEPDLEPQKEVEKPRGKVV